MTFETKIAVLVRNDLLPWQRLNVTAFTVSGCRVWAPPPGRRPTLRLAPRRHPATRREGRRPDRSRVVPGRA
jgi:hypothetical protein